MTGTLNDAFPAGAETPAGFLDYRPVEVWIRSN
jgi:hypothetical protein